MATEDRKLHVVFIPHFSPSHMIPLVEIARLFAARGVNVTIITTPYNALLVQSSVDRDISSGHQISINKLKFPSTEVGLPEGIENYSAITSPEMSPKIFQAMSLLQKPTEQLIRDLKPDCIFSDMFQPWTVDVAEDLKIPRLSFNPAGIFHECVVHSLKRYAPHDKVQSDTEFFLVPGLPHKIEMKRSQLQDHVKSQTRYGELINVIKQSELRSYGLVHNTFYEIEPAYVDLYRKVREGRRIYPVGPLSLFSHSDSKSISEPRHSGCLSWLDTQSPNSVVYACFGSMVRFQDTQLTQIALALEASDHPFIWVARKTTEKSPENEQESWLPEGYEQRMVERNKGMIIRGWAPQTQILEHPAIGGFMTHCGWGSIMEAVVAGVPLITWPLYAEQFYCEKLVELLRLGVGVGSDVWNSSFVITAPVMGKDKIENAVIRLMGSSEEAEEIGRQVKKMSVMSKRAVEEGGSSCTNLTVMIEDIKACVIEKTNNLTPEEK